MRVVLAFALLALCAASALAADAVAGDADDTALMELGIDLAHREVPSVTTAVMPTYTSIKPKGHHIGTIAKFPMLHEIKGIEAKDWSDIQGLLFREPASAAESSLDMKLDDLERKFNSLDTKPVPSVVPPKGSTLLPSLHKPELGLRAILPHKPSKPLRMQQIKNKSTAEALAQTMAKSQAKAQAKAQAKSQAQSQAQTQSQAKTHSRRHHGKKKDRSEIKTSAMSAAEQAKLARSGYKASKGKHGKSHKHGKHGARRDIEPRGKDVVATMATVKLIEKRIRGLSLLFSRLKEQIGMNPKPEITSAQRLQMAMDKHKADKADLKHRMMMKRASLIEMHADHAAEAETETEHSTSVEAQAEAELEAAVNAEADSEADAEVDAETEGESESDSESEGESESESQTESQAESETELNADAEAVDEILSTLM